MPWCKKCKMEYVNGITICPDCGEALTDNFESTSLCTLFTGDYEICRRLLQFLQYSNLASAVLKEIEQESSIFISEKELEKARKLTETFFKEEKKLSANNSLNPNKEIESDAMAIEMAEDSNLNLKKEPSHYIKKSDKYQDLKSSAVTLIFVGVLGILFVFLNSFGILPIRFETSNFLFYIVMSFIFLFFFIGGLFTLRNAQKIKGEVQEEELFISQFTDWFFSSYTAEKIDAYSLSSEELSEEIKYFKRIDYLKKELSSNFPNLDEAFADEILDIFYQKLYDVS